MEEAVSVPAPHLVMIDSAFRVLGYKTHDDPKPDLFALIKADTIGEALVILTRIPRDTVDYPKIVIERMV
jgi:hypothetical protein